MSRAIADSPPLSGDSSASERQRPSWSRLSLETQLWIEVLFLIGIGLIMIYSASSIMALKKFADANHYMKRQLFCIGLGLVAMILAANVPYRRFKDKAPWILTAVVGALALVLIPGIGIELNGARRWFNLGPFLMQPAEYAKVAWVIYLSASLIKKEERLKHFGIGFIPHVFWCGVLAGLLLLEPDFGTTFIIGCLMMLMLSIGGVPLRHLFLLIPIGALGFYKFVYHVAYRWERITAFRNPWTDPLDSGYQLIQAWIAVGSGGLFGKGLGAGQQKLFYLPEAYTDFIMAVVGEEAGFIGILAICIGFVCFFLTGLRISRSAPDALGTLIALGLTMMLSLQALLNMGVVLGLFPTKGLPLPFISYGGSAFTANCLAVGILINIARSCERRME